MLEMAKIIFSIILVGFFLLCFSQNKEGNDPVLLKKAYGEAEKNFQQAERLSLKAGDNEQLQAAADEVYARALISFNNLIGATEKTGNDSLCFFARCRAGLISYYLNDADNARKNYLSAIALKQKLPFVADSFLFIPLLYTGSIYYSQNQVDSALSFYKKAEAVKDLYGKPLNESERLYNRLGVIYYENGNYRQARNYFEKAIAVLNASNQTNKGLLINYKINIASILIKLEDFSEAKAVYESILPYNMFTDEINHNLGIISQQLGDYSNAIRYFEKVNYSGNKKIIDLHYNLAIAWSGLHQKDSSEYHLQEALAENIKWNSHRKNIPFGLILSFMAGERVKEKKHNEAIQLYQQAIMQFDAGFNETDISKNPEEFTGVFSYINLFNTLVAKADALELSYQENTDTKFLELSLAAYRSAFTLADYVEKTYDSDEARLFLGKIKHNAHSKPIDVSLLLYELTQKQEYLEAAYQFDQQNKASVLSLNVQENKLKSNSGNNKNLFEKEAALKSAITRLLLRSAQLTDTLQLQSLNASIRDYEIQLGKLQQKMNDDPAYRGKYFSSQIPAINDLQKKLDNTSCLLSWHLSAKEIVVFIVTRNKFDYYRSPVDSVFFKTIDSFKVSLQNVSSEQRYTGAAVSLALYKTLIKPFENKLSQINRLVIIPDDELNYLPFEAIRDEKGRYLVEKYSIQYQYSTALEEKDDKLNKAAGIVAFAPFASRGYQDSSGTRLSVLPASGEETSTLIGKIFTDSTAIKNNFLLSANHYGIIHLATHASVNNEMPSQSFIAFYPGTSDYKLYAQEIYNLHLDSTQLIILSACETGAGQLIKGEGLMSLSRAFAYAGCPNIITSLWKAEDKTTAFITRKLHHYLNIGFSNDKALQQAKLDMLKSDEIDPRFKTPNYWAHLLFIGNYEPRDESPDWWWIAICFITVAIIYLLFKRKT